MPWSMAWGRVIFSKLKYAGSAAWSGIRMESHLSYRLSISTCVLGSWWPVKPMKRTFPAFLAASNASMAPPGAKTFRSEVPFVIPLEHFHVRVGIVVAGETDEADLSGLLGGLKCFNGASGSENLLEIGRAHV